MNPTTVEQLKAILASLPEDTDDVAPMENEEMLENGMSRELEAAIANPEKFALFLRENKDGF